MVVPISSFRDVIALWSSIDAMASDVGAGRWSAHKWRQRDTIPAEWWSAILSTEVAKDAGLTAELLADLAARPVDDREPAEVRP
jgi:hypothetical protein